MNTRNKFIWGVGVIALLVVGAWLVFRDKEDLAERPLAEKAVGIHYVGSGVHTIEGTVALPNPCYNLSSAVEREAGVPERIILRFTAEKTADVCAQVLYEAPFRIAFDAADDAVVSAKINGIPLAVEFTRRERVSAEEGGEFSLQMGEERWVEDLKIKFMGVEDDSRCPVDVQCIQAGWVTLRLMAGGEEVRLRTPGDARVPNAAVVGSYIITLVGVEPSPRSDVPQGNRVYRATLRVEAHDIKG